MPVSQFLQKLPMTYIIFLAPHVTTILKQKFHLSQIQTIKNKNGRNRRLEPKSCEFEEA